MTSAAGGVRSWVRPLLVPNPLQGPSGQRSWDQAGSGAADESCSSGRGQGRGQGHAESRRGPLLMGPAPLGCELTEAPPLAAALSWGLGTGRKGHLCPALLFRLGTWQSWAAPELGGHQAGVGRRQLARGLGRLPPNPLSVETGPAFLTLRGFPLGLAFRQHRAGPCLSVAVSC